MKWQATGGNFSWEKHGKDPYANREPRFYATILYNGADWMGRKIESFVGRQGRIQGL